ncbi:aspartate-semialdehyde dehydrogenase [Xylella fastidiosa]|uniref:Aspartate-semialdehyde dehydrogenase n=1 Tax=Xylella fastidiosa subsp. fastidiosa TaxID=644356 RepID=A0AAJ5R2U1_XYLFS|nr:aspartate-semialdehyde dehydrogenase [Xylella fastidiosa]WCF28896.1 aspartate-semialdehyde dehydrogenase [Xylella fastidiosa subsp. fastidiosa]
MSSSKSDRCFNIAIVGATGAVGEAMLSILEERHFPVAKLIPLASARSAGSQITFKGESINVLELEHFDPHGVDIALFSAGSRVSEAYAPQFAAAGVVVIDNSSAFRYEEDVPLVVSEVNPHALKLRPRGIIANPNCSTMQLMPVLAPIHREYRIERINVATYQSVSGGGRSALEELGQQTAQLLAFQEINPKRFPVQIAFNLIPHIDDFQSNGYTKEEMKLVWETKKILEDSSIQVNPTAVRVPVFFGHSEAVNIETQKKVTSEQVRALLASAPGVEVVDEWQPGGYPTPVTHASGKDPVFVGRIRDDLSHPRGLNLWVVADNIRKGAALNAIQLAELVTGETI